VFAPLHALLRLNRAAAPALALFLAGATPPSLLALLLPVQMNRSRPDSDGIVTAEEIAAMNLEGVDLAVLSACDTGLGQIKSGEGVFGLRRAFQLAGVSSVVMSLWSVDDEMTRAWMSAMYHEYLVSGKRSGAIRKS
jgi:CHAT domain-containing protein